MSSLKFRPVFEKSVSVPADEVRKILKSALKGAEGECVGLVNEHYIVLKIPPAERHYWSPQLSVTLKETEEGTMVKGRYGPNPSVWTLFAFGYAALGIMATFFGIYGLTTWSLDMGMDALWWLPVCIGLAVFLYLTAQAGQKIGAAQMFDLHHFFEKAMSSRFKVH